MSLIVCGLWIRLFSTLLNIPGNACVVEFREVAAEFKACLA
jgi:hypothetical protein